MERRLAAILTADVVGYSRLMDDDEAGILARLEGLRAETLDPLISQHHGRIVKLMGDGFLIEFGSVVDALECAIAWQDAVEARARLVSDDRAIRFRMGINLGDVIVKGDDVFGDGVNVAARLEGLADAGDILVSRTVAEHVKGKITPEFEDLGEHKLKNISEPVQVFRVTAQTDVPQPVAEIGRSAKGDRKWVATTAVAVLFAAAVGALWWQQAMPREEPALVDRMAFPLPDKPSIAVLPFNNLSEDASEEYFADGMTEDLITDLSKISGLFVIARNSSFSYKGKHVKIRQVAEELGVRYVLEGSVRRAGDAVRINAQLIDAKTGGHVWAKRYDGSRADVFELQDRVTKQIVNALAVTLTPKETKTVSKAGTDNVAAHDAYLLGLSFYNRRMPADNATAKTHFEKAIQLDPEYSAAYAALAKVYIQGLLDGTEEYSEKLGFAMYVGTSKLWKYLQKARANPDKDYFIVRSRLALRRHQPDSAIAEARRALDISSNDAEAMEALSEALIFAGRSREGIEYAQRAMRQNPTQPGRPLYLIGLAEFSLGNTGEAAKFLNRAQSHAAKERRFAGLLAAAYGELGQTAQAKASLAEFKPTHDDNFPLHEIMSFYPFSNASVLNRFADGLKVAGANVQSGGFLPLHAANRLTGSEIKSLLFGKRIEGKSFWQDESSWQQQRQADGAVEHFGIGIQPGVNNGDTGAGKIENDMLCEVWPKLVEDLKLCVVVFRVTERIARIKWADYVMVTETGPHPFSAAN